MGMWICLTCDENFDDTIETIDHVFRCEDPYIWPDYDG